MRGADQPPHRLFEAQRASGAALSIQVEPVRVHLLPAPQYLVAAVVVAVVDLFPPAHFVLLQGLVRVVQLLCLKQKKPVVLSVSLPLLEALQVVLVLLKQL